VIPQLEHDENFWIRRDEAAEAGLYRAVDGSHPTVRHLVDDIVRTEFVDAHTTSIHPAAEPAAILCGACTHASFLRGNATSLQRAFGHSPCSHPGQCAPAHIWTP
jgi:hypothetical protein